jgi:hypothetical protein
MIRPLLASVERLNELVAARLNSKRPDDTDRLATNLQLAKFGVCLCSCHSNSYTAHTSHPCCSLAVVEQRVPET